MYKLLRTVHIVGYNTSVDYGDYITINFGVINLREA